MGGLLARLGCGADRAVVPHVDDLGSSHGANQAFLELAAQGRVTCGSVMVPAPWFREVVAASQSDPTLDIGVHLTLTSEWDHCRWAPISTVSRASGLIDEDGFFPRDVASLRSRLVPEAAEAELRAQIERAIAAGLHPTHIDAHMAAAMLPDLLDLHVRLGRDYGLFPVLPRSIRWAPDPDAYQACIAALDAGDAPVIDHCRGTLPRPADVLTEGWRETLRGLPPGLTHLALHPTMPGEFATMAPSHAGWRFDEYALLAAGTLSDLCAEAGLPMLGLRGLQDLWKASNAEARP